MKATPIEVKDPDDLVIPPMVRLEENSRSDASSPRPEGSDTDALRFYLNLPSEPSPLNPYNHMGGIQELAGEMTRRLFIHEQVPGAFSMREECRD